MSTTSGPREVRAPRGTSLTCKGWQQEAALRMLMNNLDPEVAERPEDLVVYGGTGRAARSWPAFDAIVRELRELEGDETLLVQSGKPVGVVQTHEWAPRVLIANSNLVPEWATWEEFRRLEAIGLTMYGQMTAGSWIYIGTQGILQGTYETFSAIAAKRYGRNPRGNDLAHRGARRHGRRAAAGRHDERWRRALRGGRPDQDRAPHQASLPRRRRRGRRGGVAPGDRRARPSRGPVDRHPRQRGRGRAAARRRWTRRSTSSPTRRARTIRSPTSRRADAVGGGRPARRR